MSCALSKIACCNILKLNSFGHFHDFFFNNIYLVTTLLMTILTFTWRKNKNNVQEIKEKYKKKIFHDYLNSKLQPSWPLLKKKTCYCGVRLILICSCSLDSGGSYTDSAHSFVFSFKNKDGLEPFMLHPKRTENAIYGNGNYGPTFGGGHDFYIANGAGSNTNSYSNLGHSYVQITGYTYGSSKVQSLLAGSYKFTPHEVEVFYQTYKD